MGGENYEIAAKGFENTRLWIAFFVVATRETQRNSARGPWAI